MTASRKDTKRLALLLGFTFAITALSMTPAPCFAKTRPPIEAGDPDIGNEKPRGRAQVATTDLMDTPTSRTVAPNVQTYEWLRFLTLVSYELRTLYRF
jgi:hypothetical protein